MTKVRVQMAPEIEFKMDVDVKGIDTSSRDYNVQQFKQAVHDEFMRRLNEAFPEGLKVHTFEFGLDTGWHEDLGKN